MTTEELYCIIQSRKAMNTNIKTARRQLFVTKPIYLSRGCSSLCYMVMVSERRQKPSSVHLMQNRQSEDKQTADGEVTEASYQRQSNLGGELQSLEEMKTFYVCHLWQQVHTF
jgi:hypothetical protein